MTRGRPLLVALLLGLATWFGLAATTSPPAAAHAVLGAADPADGALLAHAPRQLRLTFTEPVSVPPGGVDVLDDTGAAVATSVTVVDNQVQITFGDRTALAGTYAVGWQVVSADGHPVAGRVGFSVGARTQLSRVPATPEPGRALTLTLQVMNGVTDAALLLAVGVGAFSVLLLVGAPASTGRTRTRLRRVQLAAAVVAVVGTAVLVPVLRLWQRSGTLAGLATSAGWTRGWTPATLAPPAMVVLGLAVAVAGTRRRSGPAVVAGGLSALASLTLTGHTRAYGPWWLSYPLDLVHVAAGALWLGALVGLGTLAGRRSGASVDDLAGSVGRFSALALESLVVLAAAGVVMASSILGTPAALVRSGWGLTLLVKLVAVAVVVVVAAVNRWWVLPAVRRRASGSGAAAAAATNRLRRTLRVEAVGLAAVLAVTGVLVTQSPVVASAPPAPVPPAPAAQVLRSVRPLGEGTISVRLTPVRQGRNTLVVSLRDAVDQPVDATSPPELSVVPPDGRGSRPAVRRAGHGRYRVVVNLSAPGDWRLTIVARLPGTPPVTQSYPVTVP